MREQIAVDQIEEGRLAGAIWADDTQGLATRHCEGHGIRDLQGAERLRDIIQLEDHCRHPGLRRTRTAAIAALCDLKRGAPSCRPWESRARLRFRRSPARSRR